MQLSTALKEALKYHTVAFVPTLIGGAIIAVSLWIGVVEPALAAIPAAAGGVEGLLDGLLAAQYNLPIAIIGGVGGMLIRRIGKTALLFRIHGTTVVDVVDDELTESEPASVGPVDDGRGESADETDDSVDDDPADADSGAPPGDDGDSDTAETETTSAGAEATASEAEDSGTETDHEESGRRDGDDEHASTDGDRPDEASETPAKAGDIGPEG